MKWILSKTEVGDKIELEDGRVLVVAPDEVFPCKGICVLAAGSVILRDGSIFGCANYRCCSSQTHLEFVKGGTVED